MNPNTILQWYTYNRITRKFIHVIRVDRSVYGTVLTIIIINTNHKKQREKNTHSYIFATLGDNVSIFKDVRCIWGNLRGYLLPDVLYHILIFFLYFAEYRRYVHTFRDKTLKIWFCMLNLYCQKPVIIKCKKVTYSLFADLVLNAYFVFIEQIVFFNKIDKTICI